MQCLGRRRKYLNTHNSQECFIRFQIGVGICIVLPGEGVGLEKSIKQLNSANVCTLHWGFAMGGLRGCQRGDLAVSFEGPTRCVLTQGRWRPSPLPSQQR